MTPLQEDTPETNANIEIHGHRYISKGQMVSSDFARKLERERDQARRALSSMVEASELSSADEWVAALDHAIYLLSES